MHASLKREKEVEGGDVCSRIFFSVNSFVLLLHIIVIILVTIKKLRFFFQCIFNSFCCVHSKKYAYMDGFVTLIEIVHYRFVPLHFERLNP